MEIISEMWFLIIILVYSFFIFFKTIIGLTKLMKKYKKQNIPWWQLKEYGGWR